MDHCSVWCFVGPSDTTHATRIQLTLLWDQHNLADCSVDPEIQIECGAVSGVAELKTAFGMYIPRNLLNE